MIQVPTALEGLLGHGQDPGRTIRQPSNAFLLVDSFDRRQTADITDVSVGNIQPLNNFVLQKRQPYLTGYFNRLAVSEIRFPFVSPNVNARNNKIRCKIGSGSFVTVTLDEAFYTPTDLAASLQIELNNSLPGNNFQVVYNDAEANFAITASNAFTIAPFQYGSSIRTQKGLYFMMNMGLNLNLSDTNAIGLPSANMQYTAYIDICSRTLTQYQQVKDNSSRENQSPGVLCRLYLNNFCNENLGDGATSAKLVWPGCRPQMIYRSFPAPKFASWSPGQFIDQIDIQLFDDAGEPLYYYGVDNNGNDSANDFQITLLASEN